LIAAPVSVYWKPQDLFGDWRKGAPRHFAAGSEHDNKRRYFADE
jgi:hypothetical protein